MKYRAFAMYSSTICYLLSFMPCRRIMKVPMTSHPILFLLILVFTTFLKHSCFGISLVGALGCIEHERTALLMFKQDLHDPSNFLSSWAGDGGDCCKWYGIVCDNITGHVRELHLKNPISLVEDYDAYWMSQLSGKLNPILLSLKHLNYLDLSQNDFSGMGIPKFLGSIKSLRYLNLSHAGFDGLIPHQLGNLSNLHYLDLSECDGLYSKSDNLQWLSGLVSLKHLDLSSVYLSAASNWLEVTSTLPSLEALYLTDCQLNSLPSMSHPVNFSSLAILDLSYNDLNSSIPNWLYSLSHLQVLNLGFNKLEGTILDAIGNLTSLKHLDLSYANLSAASNWLEVTSTLPSLEELHLSVCQLNSPPSMSHPVNFSSLAILDLSNNNLNSSISNWLGKLCQLRSVDFTGTLLRQEISSILEIFSGCVFKPLESLSMSDCELSGQLTDQIGLFKNLGNLDLSHNSISGQLTNQIGQLKNLRVLYLSYNSISGPLPSSIGELSFLEELRLDNNKMNESLPISLGELANARGIWIDSNQIGGVASEIHFANLSKLNVFSASGNHITLDVSRDWSPPFQLSVLELSSWELGPSFPQWLHTQKNLNTLDISNSKISDTIPTWFPNLFAQRLYLNLSRNQIRGNVPNFSSSIYSMGRMGAIDLSFNLLEGPLPPLTSQNIELDLSNNFLSGPISQALCPKVGAILVMYLNLEKNHLSGEIPNCWERWLYLRVLILGNNRFTGHIPASIGTLVGLEWLVLRKNALSGEIPLSLRNCKRLSIIDTAENQLVGRIPTWIGDSLPKLKIIILRSNYLHGPIPEELCHLPELQILDLAGNQLSGNIPTCVNNLTAMIQNVDDTKATWYVGTGPGFYESSVLMTKGLTVEYRSILSLVQAMDLSSNNLSGEIPEEVTALLSLRFLNLSHNHFFGRIPKNMGVMGTLESLDLSVNHFSGRIPPSMSNLTFLSYLNLSYNSLSGQIPLSTQLQSFNASSFLGNRLCGRPLEENCTANNGIKPENGVGKEQSEVNWGLYVSVALGFIVGFWSVFGSLVINRRWRIRYFRFLDQLWYKVEDVLYYKFR